MDFGLPLLGFVVGAAVGMTGMGGGALMTGALIGIFGVPPLIAVGTDLIYAGITKLVGTSVHARHGNVDWRVVGLMAAGSVPAAALTLAGLSSLGIGHPALSQAITYLIGCAVLIAAATLVLRKPGNLKHVAAQPLMPARLQMSVTRALGTIVLGVTLGAVVTVSSVGAGAIGVAVLFTLYPGMKAARVVGSDIAHAVPLTLLAGFGHSMIGSVDWVLLGWLLLGSLPGIWVGSLLANRIPERLLMNGLAIVLALMGLRLLFGVR